MGPVSLELKPDRLLLDSNFDGYKLSLQEIPTFRKKLDVPIDPSHLTTSQYSLLHTKLFGLHNHLFGDPFEHSQAVYFVDKDLNVRKTYIDDFGNEMIGPLTVWKIPSVRARNPGDYGITLKFPSANLAVLSDGLGVLYILSTGDRTDDSDFVQLYSGEVIACREQGFVVSDAAYRDEKKELHVLLLHIAEDSKDRFVSVVHWVTFQEGTADDKVTWNQTNLRQLKTKGEIQYLYLEEGCENVYVISDSEVRFVLNSEYPIAEQAGDEDTSYKWSQSDEEVSVKFVLPERPNKELVFVAVEPKKIDVRYDAKVLLSGALAGTVDPSLMTWTIENVNSLEISLTKSAQKIFWPELVLGNGRGEYVARSSNFDQMSEAAPQQGATFNSQQIEECDFESDKAFTFQRINRLTNECTHKIHLGSHQVLLTCRSSPPLPPAVGTRHDVDVCLWQPRGTGPNFEVKHVGTLLAFGYVQASKQNRKFTGCSPDTNYCFVSESTGHIFIYKQNRPLVSSELRHRGSGQRFKSVAQQQVLNLANQQILGVLASDAHLFVLGEDFITAFKVGNE
ncbi:nudC domain-containing protein 1 [Cylas formicarius]|uniref:nudC domain-containing protein 1 n=1 Tax=Cylas formicarius TaxID=197179 RepID=UPI002958D04E|nr:nudC domain-containing protein 1 [Cylas formicarius]